MAIQDVRRARRLQVTESSTSNGTKTLTGTEEYLIICDDGSTSFASIADDTSAWSKIGGSLPQIGDQVTFTGYTLNVTQRRLAYQSEENDRVVVMVVQYESKQPEDPNREEPKPPEQDAWLNMSIQSVTAEMPATGWYKRDLVPNFDDSDEGFPAKNAAEEPIDGLTEEVSMIKLVYTNQLVADPNFEALIGYLNTCNDGAWFGGGDYTIKVSGYSADYDQKNGVWTITVEFLYNPKTWAIQYYDVGYNEMPLGPLGPRQAIVDLAGNPVTKPVPLDEDGMALPIGTAPRKLKLFPYKVADLTNLFSDCRI